MHKEIKLHIEIPEAVELTWNAQSNFDKLANEFTSHKTPDDQLRHLLACFGYAAYEAQSLEGSLVVLLLLLARVRAQQIREKRLDAREAAQGMTFGQLLREMKGKINLQPADAQRLKEALDLRNGMTHGFFLERALEILSETGRKKMVRRPRSRCKGFSLGASDCEGPQRRSC